VVVFVVVVVVVFVVFVVVTQKYVFEISSFDWRRLGYSVDEGTVCDTYITYGDSFYLYTHMFVSCRVRIYWYVYSVSYKKEHIR